MPLWFCSGALNTRPRASEKRRFYLTPVVALEQRGERGETAEQARPAAWDVCRGISGDLLTQAVL